MAELGLTPSMAVRALWERAAERGKDIEAMAPLLRGTSSRTRLLLCKDAWLALLEKRSARPEVQSLLEMAHAHEVDLLYPATALKDVHSALGGDTGRKSSWKGVERMRALGTAVGMDEADLATAFRYRPLVGSLDAATAVAAALRSGADYLVTYEEGLLRRSPVAALSPVDVCMAIRTTV